MKLEAAQTAACQELVSHSKRAAQRGDAVGSVRCGLVVEDCTEHSLHEAVEDATASYFCGASDAAQPVTLVCYAVVSADAHTAPLVSWKMHVKLFGFHVQSLMQSVTE